MKLKIDPITVLFIFGLFFYTTSVADRAVDGGDLNNITKSKVVAVVKHDVKKVKDEIKKIKPNNTPVYND